MATSAVLPEFVTLDQYLSRTYHPDVEYLDGILEERNAGEFDHAWVQRMLLLALARLETVGHFYALQELRVQVAKGRFRIADICVIAEGHLPQLFVTKAPLLCIEVLSPEDTYSRTQVKCRDYLDMGVAEAWILDPEQKVLQRMRGDTITTITKGVVSLEGSRLEVDLSEIFSKPRGGLHGNDSTI